MSKKSFQARIPKEYQQGQLNFCRTPICENFGVSEEDHAVILHEKDIQTKRGKGANQLYAISGIGKDESALRCKVCAAERTNDPFRRQVYHQIKSNKAAYQQFQKVSQYLNTPDSKCPNEDCLSLNSGADNKIKKAGKTHAGTQRYRCGYCKISWTGERAEKDVGSPEANKRFFKLLISRIAIRKIGFVLDMPIGTVYRRLNFIHRQCMRFIGDRERQLVSKSYDRMYLCTDSQVQVSNWTDRKIKKNVEFYGIGTADLHSSYVLAFNFNYDADVDPNEVEQDAHDAKDATRKKHNREHARLWLQYEYDDALNDKSIKSLIPDADTMTEEELRDAKDALKSSSEDYDKDETQLPHKGMAVHNEYSIIAHFMLLKRLLAGSKKTRFFMDQDTGLRTWYLAVFHDLIKKKRSDGFHVSFEKGATNDMKKKLFRDAAKRLETITGKSFNGMTHQEKSQAATQIMMSDIQSLQYPRNERDNWVANAIPSVPEPQKVIMPITDISGLSLDHQSRLIQKGSLHAIDRFFAQIRRSLAMFERAMSSGANKSRTWYGYSPYNPSHYQKLGDIYRVYYNYCQVSGKDKKTPAMRLGLAKGPVTIEKIIYRGRYG